MLALNHPFVDGNKRVAHGSVEQLCDLDGGTMLPMINAALSIACVGRFRSSLGDFSRE